jgi:hypothetical protein
MLNILQVAAIKARAVVTLCAAILLCCGLPLRAQGGAPPPLGYWVTQGGAETLLVDASGNCKFAGVNGANSLVILGACSWNPTSRGGILTIMNVYNYKPAPIRYSVVWIDQQTITVDGDVFHKSG